MFKRLKFINKRSKRQAVLWCAETATLLIFIWIILDYLFLEIGLEQIPFFIYSPILIGLTIFFYNIKKRDPIDKSIHYIVLTNIIILLLILVFVWK